jgi:small subunit ribosomal protein S6
LRLYETTLVIDSLLKSDDIERTIRNLKEFISNNGGEVVRVEEWGKRRLAYEIEKKQYGYYVYIRFQAPPNLPKLLEREYRLNDNILRYLTVLVDPKLLLKEERQKAAAQHAAKTRTAPPRPATETPEAKPAAEAAQPKAEAKPEEVTTEVEADAPAAQTADAEPAQEGGGETVDESAEAEAGEEPAENKEDKEVIES